MNLKAALLATAAGALLLVAACGGGGGDGGEPTQSQPGGGGGSGSGNGGGSSDSGGTGSSGSGSGGSCQAQTTVVGGDLFVAQPGPVQATLLITGGLTSFRITFSYSTCESNCSNPQRQDAFAAAFTNGQVATFSTFPQPPTVGSTLTLQPQPGVAIHGQMVNTFPQGTPLFLTMSDGDHFFATANTKDLGRVYETTAVVTYSSNNTAVVAFPSGGGQFDLRVGLTNVFGSGSPSGGSGGGCSM